MLDAPFACPDWWEKLQRGETPIPDGLVLDEVEAEVAVQFFNKLRVPDIPGQPTFGEVGGEWIRDIIRVAFGSIDPDTGARLVGEVLNLVPKKNSKTTNAAAIGLVAMLMNRRPNIDGVIIGPTQEVAQKCFDQAAAMIRADKYLERRFKVIEHQKTIVDLSTDENGVRLNAKLKIKSFDPKIVTGSIPAFAILDELHVMAESAHAARVIGQIRGGMITNPESLLIIISTQSEIPPSGVFKSELAYARQVRDGILTDGVRMLPVIYEFPIEIQADPEKPWKNPDMWPAILPNLGRSITIDRLVALHKESVDKGLEEEIRWASQHLNIEIGVGLHADRWPGAMYWVGAESADKLTLDRLIADCDVACVGIDGGGLDDLAALAVIGRHRQTRNWLHWARAWAQPEVFIQRKLIAPRLRDFERDGDLVIHDGGDQDAVEMAEICLKLKRAGLLPEKYAVGLDAYGVATLIDELDKCGINGDQIMSVGQGWKLQSAILTLPRKIKDKTFRHGGSPMMAWCVGNAKTELRGSNYVVTKQAAGSAKIDPLMATFNAAMLMFMNPKGKGNLDGFLANPVLVGV